MTIRLNPRWLLVPVLLLSLQISRAQTVPPSVSFDLGPDAGATTQLWDLTGNYDVNLDVQGRNGLSVPVQISFFLIQNAAGKLSTSSNNITGLVFNNDANSAFAITTKISGKVTGSDGFARAHFTVHFRGNGSFAGVQNLTVGGSMTVDAEVDPSTGQLVGTKISNFQANMGVNNVNGKSDFAAALPDAVDGSWNLTLTLAGLSKFTGLGAINMPHEAFGLHVSGKFNGGPAGGVVVLNAKGANDVQNTSSGNGSNAKLLLSTDGSTLQLDGKLLGQKMSFNVTSPSPSAQ
jgi:hypothetical protein